MGFPSIKQPSIFFCVCTLFWLSWKWLPDFVFNCCSNFVYFDHVLITHSTVMYWFNNSSYFTQIYTTKCRNKLILKFSRVCCSLNSVRKQSHRDCNSVIKYSKTHISRTLYLCIKLHMHTRFSFSLCIFISIKSKIS